MRSLDDHLSLEELTRLPENLESLDLEGAEEPLLRHLKMCDPCAQLAQAHRRLRELGPRGRSDNAACPSEEVWPELAEGLCPGNAEYLLEHASRCAACAQLLKEAIELMQPLKLEESMPGLKSSTKAWQLRLAAQLAAQNAKPSVSTARTGFLSKLGIRRGWTIISLASASVAAALLIIVLIVQRAPSDAALLALAYNQQQRRIDLRLPGGDPVPMASGTRGDSGDASEPVPLLELKTRAEKHLAKTGDDPYWNQRLGEVYLLERHGQAALRTFQRAETSNPNLPDIKTDLAAALYERDIYPEPDQKATTDDLPTAIELYKVALQSSPSHPSILYYNLAQCLIQTGAVQKAIDNLTLAKSAETSHEWREAIQAQIDRLKGRSSVSDGVGPSSLAQSSSLRGFVEDNYEALLDEAIGQWLTEWNRNSTIRERMDRLASLGLHHHDRWIHDWLEGPHTQASEEADRQLASAVQKASAGDAKSSLVNSQSALAAFSASGDVPGRVRARLAEIYAFQRLGNARECLSAASALEREASVKGYAWIRTQLTLEEASCSFLSGNYESASRGYDRGVAESLSSGLGWLYARAVAGQAEILAFRGSPLGAWQIDTEMLRFCNRIQCPPIRKYALLYDMMYSAEELDLRYAALEMMNAGVPLAEASGDATTYAYAVENLAILAGRLGDYAASDRAFAAALQVSSSGRFVGDVAIYRAEWQIDRAEILLRRGAAEEAIALLQQGGPTLLKNVYRRGLLHYYSDMAIACLATGDLTQARANALDAIDQVDLTLSSLRSVDKKEQWQRESAPEFAQLIKVYLGLKDNQKAFETWERYRSLAYRNRQRLNNGAIPALRNATFNERQFSIQPAVVLALIDNHYVGWIVDPRSLRVADTVDLGDSNQINGMVTLFFRLCSDPYSRLGDTHTIGAHLYATLLKPLIDRLGKSGKIWLEIDPSLASIPFSALTLPDGHWLTDEFTVGILSPWWTLHPEVFADDSSLPSSSRVVVVNGFARTEDDYSEAPEIARMFPHANRVGRGEINSHGLFASLKAADIFHFSGHAVAATASSYLLVAGSGESSERFNAQSLGAHQHSHRCRLAVM